MNTCNVVNSAEPSENCYVVVEKSEAGLHVQPKKLNVVIPMAGEGSRFEKQNYSYPKPLVAVGNKPMIEVVYDTLPKDYLGDAEIDMNYTFIVKKEHCLKYNVGEMLRTMIPSSDLISISKTTEGALCTVMEAEKSIDSDNPLLIANSDQYVELDWERFHKYIVKNENIDGAVLTFDSIHPKFSYASTEYSSFAFPDIGTPVTQIHEKKAISRNATCGIYYFRKGSDFVKYAKQMFYNKDKTLGEYYLAPVYNYLIAEGKNVVTYPVDVMMSLGTPEDLNFFLQSKEYKKYVKRNGL